MICTDIDICCRFERRRQRAPIEILRRARPEKIASKLVYRDIGMNLGVKRIVRAGRPMKLGPTGIPALAYLAGEAWARFYARAPSGPGLGHGIFIKNRNVDVHIRRLRKKLNANGEEDLIQTIRSGGYSLDVSND